MSSISYPELLGDIADAYRAASNTTDRVKYGELPERIAELPSGPHDNGKITADTGITPSVFIKMDIAFANPKLTGATDGKAVIGDTLGLTCSDIDISTFNKQWLKFSPESAPESMMVSNAGEQLCKLASRVYRKSYDGAAYVGYMYNGVYSGPLLVSSVSADAVIFNGGGGDQYAAGTIEYLGNTYWYSSGGYWMGGNYTDTSGLNRYKVPEATTLEKGALMLLDAVNDYIWEGIDEETGETYNADGQYDKIRCAVIGTGDFTGITKSDVVLIE